MADFSFLSDTDDSAVEELLSQTQDLCVLEQVSAINCSGFTDSVLPTELESRFRKLKSFPVTKSETRPTFDSKTQFKHPGEGKSDNDSAIFSPTKQNPKGELGLSPKSRSQHLSPTPLESPVFSLEKGDSTPLTEIQNRSRNLKAKSKCRYVSSASDSSSSDAIDEILSPSVPKKHGKTRSKANSEPESFSSPSKSSPSPPRKTGCFWCSPKKSAEKRNSGNRYVQNDLDWGKNNEFLSDLSVFSTKQQQKILKKAMKEEEKINREAEKIVKWAKQASARMNISDIGDEFSDHESKK